MSDTVRTYYINIYTCKVTLWKNCKVWESKEKELVTCNIFLLFSIIITLYMILYIILFWLKRVTTVLLSSSLCVRASPSWFIPGSVLLLCPGSTTRSNEVIHTTQRRNLPCKNGYQVGTRSTACVPS